MNKNFADFFCNPKETIKNIAKFLLMLFLVVWGLGDTMLIFSPISLFIRVDLPAFGLPTTDTKPDLNSFTLFTIWFTYITCKASLKGRAHP